ncbi:MAG TPA: hypothetical protein PKX00_09250, partial [Opitutaceae bacterium]|nr:hypothetical protein [Opitutaceae bacterium]
SSMLSQLRLSALSRLNEGAGVKTGDSLRPVPGGKFCRGAAPWRSGLAWTGLVDFAAMFYLNG